MIRLSSMRSNQFMFKICRKSKSKECRLSGNFAKVCICILEGGHMSFLDVDADPRTIWLSLTIHIYIVNYSCSLKWYYILFFIIFLLIIFNIIFDTY